MKTDVKSIIVVGGGVIGWFTAALLQKRHPKIITSWD